MKTTRKKLLRVLHGAGIVIALGVPLSAWWLEWSSQRGLQALKQQMHREGLPLTPAELKRPLPAEEQDAAPVYLQLTKTLTDRPLEKEGAALNEYPKELPVPSPKLAEIERELRRRQDVVVLVHRAAQKPECVFQRDYALGPDLLFPEYAKMRQGMRVLTMESLVQLQNGKTREAIRNETLGFAIARHAQADPAIISKLVGIALNAMTLRFMERVLYTTGERPGIADAVEDSIARNWQPVQMWEGMRGEIIMNEVICDQLRAGKTTFTTGDKGSTSEAEPETAREPARSPNYLRRAIIDASELDMLQYLHRQMPLMQLPYLQGHAKLKELTREIETRRRLPTRTLTAILMPVFSQARGKQAQGEAQKAVVCAAAAVLAYKQKHGKFPATLEQTMPTVPTDPFDGQPLRYDQEVDSFVVYSVGASGKFDGGTANKRPDSSESVFRYPMPAWYTQSR